MEKGKAKNGIQIPITRDGMVTLCNSMNLKIKPTKAIDAVIYCRGPKMEQSPEEDFNIEKLVHWFQMNMKTMQHADPSKADQNWVIKQHYKA